MSRFVFDPATGLMLPRGAVPRVGKRLCSLFTVGPGFFGGVGSTAGALDAFSSNLVACYGIVRLRSSAVYSGSAIRVRRSTGGDTTTQQDIGFAGTALDTSALATFAGSQTVVVTKIYDQSGNGKDLAQATGANQPRIVNAGTYDGKIVFDGTNDDMSTSATFGTPTVYSTSLKANFRTSATQAIYQVGTGSNTRAFVYIDNSSGKNVCYTLGSGGSVNSGSGIAISPPAQRVWGYIHDLAGATSALQARIFLNGSEQVTSVVFSGLSSGNYTANILTVGSSATVNWAAMDLYSFALWQSQQSANMAGIAAAMA